MTPPVARRTEAGAVRLDPATRDAVRALHRVVPAANVVALAYAALWAAGAWLVLETDGVLLRGTGVVAAGVGIHALATLLHEGSHGNLWRRRGLDRWTAFVCGLGSGLGATAYRVTHLEHHRHVRTARDPEEFTAVSSSRAIQSAAFWTWGVLGALTYPLFVPCIAFARGTRRDRWAMSVEYVAMAVVYAGVWTVATRTGRTDEVLLGWILPLVVVLAITNTRGWAEHAMTPGCGRWTGTRTVTTNRVVSFLMGGTNYHLEHHLFPGVPWYRLRRLHGLLAPYEAAAGAPVQRSYLRFLWAAVRTGVHGVIPGER